MLLLAASKALVSTSRADRIMSTARCHLTAAAPSSTPKGFRVYGFGFRV